MSGIMRQHKALSSVAVDTVLGDADEVDLRNYAGGLISVPTGSSITSLTFYAAPAPGGTYLAAYDATATAITLAVGAEKSYELPSSLFGAGAIKLVGNVDGVVDVSLKG